MNAAAEIRPDRKLIFVHDVDQWELSRKLIIERLSRYGFEQHDRVCISMAIDEAMLIALELKAEGACKSAMIAYFLDNSVFHMRIRFIGEVAPHASSVWSRDPWLLAAACMSGVRTDNGKMELEMWKESTFAKAAAGMDRRLWH